MEGSSGRGDSDMGLYDDARPNNQRSEGPSKENPDHESNSEDQQVHWLLLGLYVNWEFGCFPQLSKITKLQQLIANQ